MECCGVVAVGASFVVDDEDWPAVLFLLCMNIMPIVATDSDFGGRSGVGRRMRCLLLVIVQLILIQCYKSSIQTHFKCLYIFYVERCVECKKIARREYATKRSKTGRFLFY